MSDELRLRRHLYELLAGPPRRRRRMFRRQLKVLAMTGAPGEGRPPEEPDGGTAGVREPRRPLPPSPPAARALPLP